MATIPTHVKIGIINNYIQANYLKSRGKAEHDEWLISEILESIKDDLTRMEKEQNTEKVPLEDLTRDLKLYKEGQYGIRRDIGAIQDNVNALLREVNKLKDSLRDPEGNLEKVIKKLEKLSGKI